MNGRITRLYAVLAVLFALLIGTVSYWQVIAAPGLATRQANQRLVYRELAIDRGRIVSSDGVVLARNRKIKGRDRDRYLRVYPEGGLAAHLVGYSTVQESRAGLEDAYNGTLTGSDTDLRGSLGRLLDTVRGRTVVGDDLELTLVARAQREAMAALEESGRRGSVVALDPRTGGVLVLASWPTFDPGDPKASFDAPGAPLLDRATQGLYPPGSTFKVVTAAAALDRGVINEGSRFSGPDCVVAQTRPLCNFRGEAPGDHDFRYALVHSINTSFAAIGKALGQQELEAGMASLGFFAKPPLPYPSDQIAPSGIYTTGGRLQSRRRAIDVERTAIGQGRLLATPLQMAMVASAVANGGTLLQPQAVLRVRDASGRIVSELRPRTIGEAMDRDTAALLADVMQDVVDDGTGTSAQIPGLAVAGKTGTAETGRDGQNDAWFLAFAPAESPRVALAVVVEDTDQTGGQIAAPIAARVIRALDVEAAQ